MSVRLSKKQEYIVKKTEGALLVTATAGSGKTRVLTERVRYLLDNKKGHYRVMALTFTNKAAEEMQNRLEDIPELKEKTFIGTIHNFCIEVIKNQGNTIGLKDLPHIFESESDRIRILREVLESNTQLKEDFLNTPNKEKYLYNCLDFISKQKRNLSLPEYENDWHVHAKEVILYKAYRNLLMVQDAMDFDDILVFAYRIFTERPRVAELYRKLYKYICIDEAQDLNYAQYEIIKAICGESHRNVLMVGDPNQAIYGFNGSDKKYMCEYFKKDFNAESVELNENYRSSKAVINIANHVNPGNIDLKTVMTTGESEITSLDDEEKEAIWVVEKIKTLLQQKTHPDIEGEIRLDNIAVLARNKYVFKPLEKELEKNPSITFYYKKSNEMSESESELIKMFDLGTRIIINPKDEIHFARIRELAGIKNPPDITYESGYEKLASLRVKIIDPLILEQFEATLNAWKILSENESDFNRALDTIKKYIQKDIKPEDTPQMALILNDIEEWEKLWTKYKKQVSKENRSLKHFRSSIAMGTLQIPHNLNGLTLGTIHSVKGLEYDIVFLIGMTEGTFPDYRAIKSGNDAMKEEKNNAFVAITRAKRLLYITYPLKKFMPWKEYQEQKKSRFLP